MSEFLFHYNPVHPTTWAYLSSLLMIGLFVKFGRFWSVRNLDLCLLIALAPGLLFVHFGEKRTQEELAAGDLLRQAAAATSGGSLVVSLPVSSGDEPTALGPQPQPDAAMTDVTPATPTAAEAVNPDNLFANSANSAESANGDPGVPADRVPDEEPSDLADLAGTQEPATEMPASPSLLAGSEVSSAESDATVGDETLKGRDIKAFGFIWLLATSGLLLVRLLFDPAMVRRPLLEPNLSTGGLAFIGCFLFLFLMANVVSSPVTEHDMKGPRGADRLLAVVAEEEADSGDAESPSEAADPRLDEAWNGPGNAVLYLLPNLVTMPQLWGDALERSESGYTRLAKAMAILSHLAVVIGIVVIGYRHFGNIQTGIGTATLYLMLPYTAQMTGRVDHVLPAALLVWAVVCYRRPLPTGMFIGLAIGVAYYPIFLLPLWVSFYWQRGLMRFVSGVLSMSFVLAVSMIFVSEDMAAFGVNIQRMFGLRFPLMSNLGGMWGLGWEPMYRIPVLAAYVCLSGTLAIWPGQKNLGTLLSCSAALMVATQFWHGDGGGLYMAWFLPLTLLTIFRPNLEDRVALTVLGAGWFPRRFKAPRKTIDIAA